MVLIVKGLEGFAVVCAAYVDCASVKAGVVKCVHGLTVFKHNVVCNVYDVVDGSYACRTESHSEPERRGSDLYVLYNLCCVSEAEVAVVNINGKVVRNIVAVAEGLNLGCGNGEFLIEGNCAFSCKTDNGETVGTVGSDFKLNYCVVEHESFSDVHTNLVFEFGIENENTVLNLTGHIVACKVKLAHRAEHTVGGNSTELAGLDCDVTGEVRYGNSRRNDVAHVYVLRACNDLCKLAITNVHLADEEVVGVGVSFHRNNLCHNYVLNVFTENLEALNLRACVSHSVAELLRCQAVCICKIV